MKNIGRLLDTKESGVISVTPQTSILEAARLMAERDIGLLAVMSDGELMGVVSERDYVRRAIPQGMSAGDTPVSEIMTTGVVTGRPDQKIDECARMMVGDRIRHLPIVDGEQCVGIVTLGDLIAEMADNHTAALAEIGVALKGHWWL